MFSFFKRQGKRTPVRLQVGDLEAELVQKNIRYVHLRVFPPDGRVVISAPFRVNLETIQKFALSKLDWIKKQQIKLRGQKAVIPPQYQNGENHYVWGSPYLLSVEEGHRSASVALSQDRIILRVRRKTSLKKRKAVVDSWYANEVQKCAPPLIAKWEPMMGVKVVRLSVRRMKSRWGSCNTLTQAIRLNSELAKKPRECLEYVVIHEMVHLLERRHNARFRKFMDQFMPEWKAHKKLLNRFSCDEKGLSKAHE
jgi:predicted metal-dependent hydrolase